MNRLLILLMAVIFVCLPLLLILLWAFANQWSYPSIFPSVFSKYYLQQVLADPSLGSSIINSSLIALFASLLTLVIALPAAKFFAFQTIISNRLAEFIIYLPLILPIIAIVTSCEELFIGWQWSGSYFGVILLHCFFMLPYALQILVDSYRKMGKGYQEAAGNLQAGSIRIFTEITFPLLRPSIATAAGLIYIISFSQYLPSFFIGGGKIITLPLVFLPYAYGGRWGIASVYSILFTVTCLLGVGLIRLVIGGNYGFIAKKRQH